jgi:hypothetical protein
MNFVTILVSLVYFIIITGGDKVSGNLQPDSTQNK